MRLLKLDKAEKIKKAKHDPNVVGLKQSSDDSSSESEDEDDDDDKPQVIENQNNVLEITDNEATAPEKEIDNSIAETNVKTEIEKKDNPNDAVKKKDGEHKKREKQVKIEPKRPLLEHATKHVEVKRDPKIQVARLKLPILGEEQRIMELVNENEFLVVCGETGKVNLLYFIIFLH